MLEETVPDSSENQERAGLIELRKLLLSRFSLSKLKDLIFLLGINYEDLPGDSRVDKIRELIVYMQRQGRLQELKVIAENDPHLSQLNILPGTQIDNENIGRQISSQGDVHIEGNVGPGTAIGHGAAVHAHIIAETVNVERYYESSFLPIPLQLPTRPTFFIGRERELAELLTHLRPGHVFTLTGPGGVGKSALAAEALHQLTLLNESPARFPDGIIFHNFYNQPEVAIALEQVALAFGEEPRPTPSAAARRVLSRRQALIVLDGAENADDLRAILDVRGRSGVLITSRRHEDAEHAWQDVRPLPENDAVTLLQKWAADYAHNQAATHQLSNLVRCRLTMPIIKRQRTRLLS